VFTVELGSTDSLTLTAEFIVLNLHLSQLSRLRAFAAVGRHLSFKLAAAELHVTQSALSHHVRQLEAEVGPLFHRLHRRIELTPSGERLLAECMEGFRVLTKAMHSARGEQEGPLTISVAPYFSARWLTPRLSSLWARHPDLDLQLRHAYQPADFLHDTVDAGIGWGSGNWPDAISTLVLRGDLTPVCSPEVRRRLPRKLMPADLLGERLLCEFDALHWEMWFNNAGVVRHRKLKCVQIDDSHALRRSAIDGHGVALFFRGLINEDIESGALQAPFKLDVDPGSAYYLLTPKARRRSRKLEQFSSWLLSQMSERHDA
jgi:DNA-binding transcriptional LysR family regulator